MNQAPSSDETINATIAVSQGQSVDVSPSTLAHNAEVNRRITAANWHLTDRCNYSCKFCFMDKLVGHEADIDSGREIILRLKEFGITKLNFVGGEPLLHPYLKEFATFSKENGLTVSIVSNGYFLTEDTLRGLKPIVDWIGISIDSAKEDVEAWLGRGAGKHVQNSKQVCREIRNNGIKLKINTVVTKLNYSEDLRALISDLRPQRWKVFQMLGILDQNERHLAELAATKEEFEIFKQINSSIELDSGLSPVFETNEDMVDSYLMLGPDGSVIQNTDNRYAYHPLKEALASNLAGIVNERAFLGRGGKYDW